jgi:hypothetical protein
MIPTLQPNELLRARADAAVAQHIAAAHVGLSPHDLDLAEHGRIRLDYDTITALHAFYAEQKKATLEYGIAVCTACGLLTKAFEICMHCGNSLMKTRKR